MRPQVQATPEYGQTQLVVRTGIIVTACVLTMFFGFWLTKAPCVFQDWDGKQYGRGLDDQQRRYFTLPCYTDIVPLWSSPRLGPTGELIGERLDMGKIPYVQAPNEYPVLTGVLQWFAGLPLPKTEDPARPAPWAPFFYSTAILLGAAAIATTVLLGKMVGARAMYFALSPTLLIYGLMNWDLLAVLLATAGTYMYLRREDGWAGGLLGLGAAAKLYPGLLVAPFALGRLKDDRGAALRVAGFAAGAWVLANLPFALFGRDNWLVFFRFNAERGADWDSAWFLIAEQLGFSWDGTLLNLLSLGSFVALAVALWSLKVAREPDFPRWSFAFPLVVAFLLTNKVYSPQYGLWLLPLFALCLPSVRTFVAFSIADVAVYYTRFRWFGELEPTISDGVPFGSFKLALLVRMAVLVLAVVLWVRRPTDRRAEELVGGGSRFAPFVPADGG